MEFKVFEIAPVRESQKPWGTTEVERLRKRVAMLEAERGPGIKAPEEAKIEVDIDWD